MLTDKIMKRSTVPEEFLALLKEVHEYLTIIQKTKFYEKMPLKTWKKHYRILTKCREELNG